MASVHADHRSATRKRIALRCWLPPGGRRRTDGLATVGLVPAAPVTGFGYIEFGAPTGSGVLAADRAPPSCTAAAGALPAFDATVSRRSLLRRWRRGTSTDGRHLWNLGLFAWTARRFLAELDAADPPICGAALSEVVVRLTAGDRETVAGRLYSGLRVQPVEPLVLERTRRLTVVQASFGWSDLGSWTDVWAARVADGEGDAAGTSSKVTW